jgi:hypothetical protein
MKNSYSTGIVVNLDLSLNPGSISIGGGRYLKTQDNSYPNVKTTNESTTTYTNTYFVAAIDEIKFSRFATVVFILSD